ncbi:MAG: adenosine kinase [Bacteroidales bacterium]|jgi:sugar/nucleoside kinase (ribokinase family)
MKKILGMGNALVDIMIRLENEQLLKELDLPKGSMQLVDALRSKAILDKLEKYPKSFSAGGSAANTIHGLAMLGNPVGYLGVIGEDELGGSFVKDMINAGVEPHMIHSKQETGRAIALITPDSERTFATFLGAALELEASNLELFDFSKYDYLHIEGYLVQNHNLIRTAVTLAKKNNLMVSLDLASYNVVEANLDFLREIAEKYVDILFANEEEAKAFTGQEPREALDKIAKMVRIAVIKTGSKGSLIKSRDKMVEIGVINVRPVDTTGAGDLYASGFLYGQSNDLPLKKCGEIGTLLAGHVIEVVGSKMGKDKWMEIRKMTAE